MNTFLIEMEKFEFAEIKHCLDDDFSGFVILFVPKHVF